MRSFHLQTLLCRRPPGDMEGQGGSVDDFG